MPLTAEEELELLELEELEAQDAQSDPEPQATNSGQSLYSKIKEVAMSPEGFSGHFQKNMEQMRADREAGVQPSSEIIKGTPPMAIPAGAAPKALSKLAEWFQGGLVRRTGAGAVQGAIENPNDPLKGAAKGAAFNVGGEAVAKPLGKIGDVAMQMAVGRKKYTPGVGTALADEGLWGTHGRMSKQVERKLGETGEEMAELASQVPAIDSGPLAGEIVESASRPLTGMSGAPSTADMPKIAQIKSFGDDVASRGVESGSDALARRIAAGQRAYRGKEDPLQSLLGQMSKKEQQVYSRALKEGHAEQMATQPPSIDEFAGGGQKSLADVDERYAALKRAEKGLQDKVTMPQSLFQLLTVPAKAIPGGAVGMSTVGQGAAKASDLANLINDPIVRQKLLGQ